MEESNKELFGVMVDPAKLSEAKRTFALTKWIFGLGLFYILLFITSGIIHATYSNPERYRKFLPYYLELKLSTWNALIYSIIFAGQLFAYLRFTRKMTKGLEASDSETYNQSFDSLIRYNQLYLCGMILVVMMGILSVWVQFDFANASVAAAAK